nr:hypothetical protein 11 [Desulfobulbaceae bacterium]
MTEKIDLWALSDLKNRPFSGQKLPCGEKSAVFLTGEKVTQGKTALPFRAEKSPGTVMKNQEKLLGICRPCPHFLERGGIGGCNHGQWVKLDQLDHCPKILVIRG